MHFLSLCVFLFYLWTLLIQKTKCIGIGHKVNVRIQEIPSQINETKNCIFPSSLSVTIETEEGIQIQLFLQIRTLPPSFRNKPIYIVRRTNKEPVVVKDTSLSYTEDFRFYYDPWIEETSIFVRCLAHGREQDRWSYVLEGQFLHKGALYKLQHSFPGNPNPIQYILSNTSYDENSLRKGRLHDYVFLPSSEQTHHVKENSVLQNVIKRRPRRQVDIQRPYTIDTLVVIDYRVYKQWYETTSGSIPERDSKTKEEIRSYFSHFMHEVGLRYENINIPDLRFKMKVTGFIIINDPITFLVTELKKEPGSPRQLLEANESLKDFRAWVNNTQGLPPHDHAILFTGYDLYTVEGNVKQIHTAGLAYIRTMCKHGGDSVSIVEDHGGFQNVATAAHEIGHSLGARHDGENNACSSEDYYVMRSSDESRTVIPPQKRLNQWHFSSCSIQYFRSFVDDLTREGFTCLTETYSDATLTTPTEVPGQIYDPDEQCRMIWGKESYLCRGTEFGNASTICSSMYCRDPNTENDCVLHTAVRGTSCGDKMWCSEGVCTYSDKAPEKDGSCVLGDQPGVAFIGKSCEELVRETPSYCYQEKVRARCCSSCAKQYTWISGCEYGDRVNGCKPYHCNMVSTDNNVLKECCSTCSHGKRILTTIRPSFTIGPITTLKTDSDRDSETCHDTATVNGQSCQVFTYKNGRHVCYDSIIERSCCKTCSNNRDVILNDCKYGDRQPSFCSQQSDKSRAWCETYGEYCCKTCHDMNIDSGAKALTFSVQTFLLITAILVLV